MLEHVVGEGAASSQQAVLKVCVNKGALDIWSWVEQKLHAMQEQVSEYMCLDSSWLVLLGDQEQELGGEELLADLFGCGAYSL